MAASNVLKSKPSQKDLEKIKQKVGDKWRSLLTNLGEEQATIQGFLGNSHGKETEACFKGLVYWLEGNADSPVTWETLLKALRESELKGFAGDLEKELTSQSQGEQNSGQSKPSASKDPEEQFLVLKTSQGTSSMMPSKDIDEDTQSSLNRQSTFQGAHFEPDSSPMRVHSTEELFKQFKGEFLRDGTVPARNIARRLYDGRLIPQKIQTMIMNATWDNDAASILYRHMAAQATKESAQKLFDIMINTVGYQKMNDLGRRMLDALQNVSNLECTTLERAMKEKLDLLISYQEALEKHGKVSVEVIRSLLVGPSGVGKSSLRHLLVHGESKDIKASTPVMETPDVMVVGEHYAVDDENSIWKQVTKNCLHHSVKQCTRERRYEESPHYPATIGSSSSDVQAENIVSHQDLGSDGNSVSYSPSNTQSTAANDRLQTRPKEVNHLEAAREAVLSSSSVPEEEIPLQNAKFIHVIDSGGQPAFQDILPLLLAIPCVYLQIFDASKGFHERIRTTYRPKSGSEQQLPSAYPAETHWEFIQRTLSSMQTMVYKFKCRALQTFRHTPPEFRVIFVGTFKDKIEDIPKVKDSIQKSLNSLEGKPYFDNVHFAESEEFFLVDNHMTLHSSQADQKTASRYLNKLRECISDARYALKVDVPLMWFLVEIITRSSDKKFITEAELKEFCLRHQYIDRDRADKQFPCLLKLFHFLGFFAHYDLDSKYLKNGINYVCTDATSFYKEVSKLLAVQYSSPKSGATMAFRQTGVIRNPYNILFNELKISPDVDPVWFLEALHHLGITARLDSNTSDTPPSYFIPSCLPYRNAQVPNNCSVGPLCLTYIFEKDGFPTHCDLPRSVFCRLVVELVKKKGWRDKIAKDIGRTLIKFFIDETLVILTEEPGHIRCELAVCEHFFPKHLMDKDRIQKLYQYCSTLRETLLSTLEHITREIFGEEFRKSAKIHPVLHCTVCQKMNRIKNDNDCMATCIPCQKSQPLSPRQKVWFAPLESSEARVLLQNGVPHAFWNLEESNGVPRNTCDPTKMYPSDTERPPPTKKPKTVIELFKLFKKEFLQDGTVPAQNIARRLYDGRVIPQEIQTKIMNATCDYDAASILYGHMTTHADKESAKKLFNIMINTVGYQKMNDLGRRMLDAWQNLVRNPESTGIISGHRDDIRQRRHGLHDRESRKSIPKPSRSATPSTWCSCLARTPVIIMILLLAVLVVFLWTGKLSTRP